MSTGCRHVAQQSKPNLLQWPHPSQILRTLPPTFLPPKPNLPLPQWTTVHGEVDDFQHLYKIILCSGNKFLSFSPFWTIYVIPHKFGDTYAATTPITTPFTLHITILSICTRLISIYFIVTWGKCLYIMSFCSNGKLRAKPLHFLGIRHSLKCLPSVIFFNFIGHFIVSYHVAIKSSRKLHSYVLSTLQPYADFFP